MSAIFDLACQKPYEPVKTASIAKRQKIPRKFLELILLSLKQGDFVESRRGVDGGYFLARPAEAITVGEVLRFIDGSGLERSKRRSGETPFSELWRNVDRTIAEILDRENFALTVRKWLEKQSVHVPDWEI